MLILEANNTIAPVPKPGTTILFLHNCYYLMHRVRGLSLTCRAAPLLLSAGRKYCAGLSNGIGLQGLETPVMETRVGQKILTQPGRLRQAFVSVRWSVA